MKRVTALTAIMFAWTAHAADLGVDGNLFPITEPDLIEAIKAELGRAEKDGRLEQFNNQLVEKNKRVLLDPPSLGFPSAFEDKSWTYDPSIVVQKDIKTHQGVLIAARGTRVNPLDTVALGEPLLFVDGEKPSQMEWALGLEGKLILTGGSPKHLMDTHDRRMFFDQQAILTSKFGITALPARVSQVGKLLRVEEIYVETKEPVDG